MHALSDDDIRMLQAILCMGARREVPDHIRLAFESMFNPPQQRRAVATFLKAVLRRSEFVSVNEFKRTAGATAMSPEGFALIPPLLQMGK